MLLSSTSRRLDQRFNLPNLLTYGRLLAVPVVVACLFWSNEFIMRWIALGIFFLLR